VKENGRDSGSKGHTPRYSTCLDGELSIVVDFTVGTNWVRDQLDIMWDGKGKAIPVLT
jgi:hypothetical protein